jgi:hypothetical protein
LTFFLTPFKFLSILRNYRLNRSDGACFCPDAPDLTDTDATSVLIFTLAIGYLKITRDFLMKIDHTEHTKTHASLGNILEKPAIMSNLLSQ